MVVAEHGPTGEINGWTGTIAWSSSEAVRISGGRQSTVAADRDSQLLRFLSTRLFLLAADSSTQAARFRNGPGVSSSARLGSTELERFVLQTSPLTASVRMKLILAALMDDFATSFKGRTVTSTSPPAIVTAEVRALQMRTTSYKWFTTSRSSRAFVPCCR